MKNKKYYLLLCFSILFSCFLHGFAIFLVYKHFLEDVFLKGEISSKKEVQMKKIEEKDILTFAIQSFKDKDEEKVGKFLICQKIKKKDVDFEQFYMPIPSFYSKVNKSFNFLDKKFIDIDLNEKFTFKKFDFLSDNNIFLAFKKRDLLKREVFLEDAKEKKIPKVEEKTFLDTKMENFAFFAKKIKEKNFYYKDDLFENFIKKIIEENKNFQIDKKMPLLLDKILNLEDMQIISCAKDFDVEVEYVKKGEKYIFALLFIPKQEHRRFERIKQNFYFLIDKSNSIQNKRLNFTRHAVLASLSKLQKEDKFNILMFDSKLDFLFSSFQPVSKKVIFHTKEFFRRQKLGSFFYSKNFFLPLKSTFIDDVKEDEINNIIFITDGEGLNKNKNKHLIKKWSEFNNYKRSLYSLALTEDKNSSILDFFSSCNNGEVITSSTLRGMRRHLLKLMKKLSYPIAKDVTISIFSKENNKIVLSSRSQGRNIYLNDLFVVLGSIEKLDDFTVFIQGKSPNGLFHLKKRINFVKEKKENNFSLEKKWAQYKAFEYYDKYLADGKKDHLKKAKQILDPFNLPIIFR